MRIALDEGAVYAACAETMFAPGVLAPDLDERMAGWRIVGYLTALNSFLGLQRVGIGERVFYGFVAQECADPMNYVAVVRGTETVGEWIQNARVLPTFATGGGMVERGFWEVYDTMHFRRIDDDLGDIAPIDLADTIHDGATVTVIGHSLGAALATFLCRELKKAADGRFAVQGQFFASPKCCDDRYAEKFDAEVGAANYLVVNYERDKVPFVPPIGYVHLPHTRWLKAGTIAAPDDPVSAHDVLNYAARIRAEDQPATTGEPA